jgi:APA family basic amino acid/polyamine antiporter
LARVSASDRREPRPARLGLWSAVALVVGHTIAVGIFLTPAELIGALASPALTLGLWASCGLLVLAGAFTFGELASRFPSAGGLYVYLKEGWGERIAFLYGWQSMLVMDPGITAALATGLAGYLVLLWPAASGLERWIAIAAIWAMAAVSMSGLTLSARVLGSITALKVLAFAALVAVAFTGGNGDWSHFQPFLARPAAPAAEAAALGLVSVFFSFGGFWEASRMAGEVHAPSRTVPMALAIGVSCVTLVYIAMTMAFIYLVPIDRVTSAPEFARLAGEAMFGAAGPRVLASAVVLSVVASMLALLIMAPRLYSAMSRDGLFVAALTTENPATSSPVRATALLAVLASVLAFVGSFQQIVAFFMCTTLVFVALAAGAVFVVRRSGFPRPAPPFLTPGYPLTSALFVLLVAAVVVLIGVNRPLQAIAGLAIVLLGVPAYAAFAARRGGATATRVDHRR